DSGVCLCWLTEPQRSRRLSLRPEFSSRGPLPLQTSSKRRDGVHDQRPHCHILESPRSARGANSIIHC
ncbi:hypothetical protein RB213_014928, partial [Colletotrichum asianum]